jgi:hypothetical protein
MDNLKAHEFIAALSNFAKASELLHQVWLSDVSNDEDFPEDEINRTYPFGTEFGELNRNIYEWTTSASKAIADALDKPRQRSHAEPLTFTKFQASRTRIPKMPAGWASYPTNMESTVKLYIIAQEVYESSLDRIAAFHVYDRGCCIAEFTDGSYYLIVSNQDYSSENLTDMEVHLYKDHYLSC